MDRVQKPWTHTMPNPHAGMTPGKKSAPRQQAAGKAVDNAAPAGVDPRLSAAAVGLAKAKPGQRKKLARIAPPNPANPFC
jgi:hypothetical protein